MKPVKDMAYHPTTEKLVEILCKRTRNNNPLFFRVHAAYYFAVIATSMRATIRDYTGDVLPVNLYAINLAPSGAGKGNSTNYMEKKVLANFFTRFEDEVFPLAAELNLPKVAAQRASRKGVDPDTELARAQKEFEDVGPLVMSFDSGTTAAVRQARHKLLLAKAGALNFQMDEIGSNLTGNMELLTTFLELYDVGFLKQKMVKNTAENTRYENIRGNTPANMMLFGTPAKLFNGSKVEEEFYSMQETGYARRCLFGFSMAHDRTRINTVTEMRAQRNDTSDQAFIDQMSVTLGDLADMSQYEKCLPISDKVAEIFDQYQLDCETLAEQMGEHDEMRKAEMSHRHFKAKKLAGAYAFVDAAMEVTEDHAYNAIKLVEASGDAFGNILTRDRPYVKLAKYIAAINRKVTQADLVEDLPFYRGSISQKQEMMQLAIAHGYQNSILIKKEFCDGIEFIRGETLETTNLSKMRVSYSADIAREYRNETAPFDQLHVLTQHDGLHWVNHHLEGGHRQEDNAIPGFNMVVIDVDKGVNLSTAMLLLKDYKALFYTTKRHTDAEHRFRIIMPTNFVLKLDAKDYKEFMANLFSWLPFEVDLATNQRARKWLSHDGEYHYQEGDLLDVLPFIPKTTKNEARRQLLDSQQSMDNLERWVINNTGDGNRNNQLLRYAMILVDAGFTLEQIQSKTMDLNDKMADKLEEVEILSTIMITVAKALTKKQGT